MRKLNEYETKLIREIILENNAIFEMEDRLYNLSLIEEPGRTKNTNLNIKSQQKYEQTKLNILNGKNFCIDEVVEMMDCGVL